MVLLGKIYLRQQKITLENQSFANHSNAIYTFIVIPQTQRALFIALRNQ